MKLNSNTDAEILAIANPIMNNLMEGSNELDYAKHCQDFSDRMKEAVTAQYFAKAVCESQEKRGLFTEREFVRVFRRGDSVAVLWKQSCSKNEDELMAQLVLVEVEGDYLVEHAIVW